MNLVFVLKWVKSVIGCTFYIFHLSAVAIMGQLWEKIGVLFTSTSGHTGHK